MKAPTGFGNEAIRNEMPPTEHAPESPIERKREVPLERIFSAEEQARLLSIWGRFYGLHGIFYDSRERFLKACSGLDKDFSIVGGSESELVESIVGLEIRTLFSSNESNVRDSAYGTLQEFAARYQGQKGPKHERLYQLAKNSLREALDAETNNGLRKKLVKELITLSNRGEDMTIVADLADSVKQDSKEVKSRHENRKQPLSPEGMAMLRGLLGLSNEDANRAVYELMMNPEIDPRIKKYCLASLCD
jgi:hypothetical protein